jgi:hypothetical protein
MVYKYLYTYEDFVNTSIINIDEIQEQINALSFNSASLLYIDSGFNPDLNSNIVELVFSNQLSSEEHTLLEAFVANYTGTSPKTDNMCKISDIKDPGTNGGTFTQDIWTTRTLNTLEGNVDFATLSNNIITIQPGIYFIIISAPSCNTESHQIRFRNITDGTYILGTSEFSTKGIVTKSNIQHQFTFTASKQLDVQHICSQTSQDIGFGRATGYGINEIYTTVFIQRID